MRQAARGQGRGPARTIRPLLLAALLPFAALPLRAEDPIFAPGGVALSGYDAVSYFEPGGPARGSADHALRWRGVLWYFATAPALERFEMDPDGFAPQFGGYCAAALAEGRVEGGRPTVFLVRDGKLYLAQDDADLERLRTRFAEVVAAAAARWPDAEGAGASARISASDGVGDSGAALGWGLDDAELGADDPGPGPAPDPGPPAP